MRIERGAVGKGRAHGLARRTLAASPWEARGPLSPRVCTCHACARVCPHGPGGSAASGGPRAGVSGGGAHPLPSSLTLRLGRSWKLPPHSAAVRLPSAQGRAEGEEPCPWERRGVPAGPSTGPASCALTLALRRRCCLQPTLQVRRLRQATLLPGKGQTWAWNSGLAVLLRVKAQASPVAPATHATHCPLSTTWVISFDLRTTLGGHCFDDPHSHLGKLRLKETG